MLERGGFGRLTMPRFNLEEVLRFAVTIEKNGERFYRDAATRVSDLRARAVFLHLAHEEVAHEQLFSRLLGQNLTVELDERHGDDYLAYLQAFVDHVAFRHSRARAELGEVTDEAQAISFAMQREQDSISFYTELRSLVPEDERAAIDAIIEEERSHFRALAELAAQLKTASQSAS